MLYRQYKDAPLRLKDPQYECHALLMAIRALQSVFTRSARRADPAKDFVKIAFLVTRFCHVAILHNLMSLKLGALD